MKRYLPLCFLLALIACQKSPPLPQTGEPIGVAVAVEGESFINDKPASVDAKLMAKDILETRAGKMKIKLADDSTIALSENSRIILTEFYIEGGGNFRKSTIEMIKGQIRSIVSKHFTAAGSGIDIQTSTVVAGIRGTELVITADEATSSVYCLDGNIEVFKPQEKEKKFALTKDMYVKAEATQALEEPRPIPPELRKALSEDYVPADFRVKSEAFEAEYEAKKAEMKAKEIEMKKKMEEKKKNVEEKMKKNQQNFDKKRDDQQSKMDKQREDMLKKMKERQSSGAKKTP